MVTILQRDNTPSTAQPELRTLVDELLAEQGRLQTPVARFAETHDREPDLAGHYRSLIPLTRPGDKQQYAFEVSLDRCTGCKACVSACNSLNGLDENEVWRDTGTIVGGTDSPGWQQTVTTACHHCESPECMHGCPVGAYEKDPSTGIVRHLDDQCIGCSYCILKCAYDVPKYSKSRGIVRKCDMCHQRLSEGEAPACVQACPTEAIRIVIAPSEPKTTAARRSRKAPSNLLQTENPNPTSALPDSSITFPTTRYIGRYIPKTVYAADRNQLKPEHTHWPLVLMLVLTQAGIGLAAAGSFGNSIPILVLGTVIFNAGMLAAVFHLGQPLKAWRFFIGLKTSWLSREILAFSLFSPIPATLCALAFLPDFPFKHIAQAVSSYSLLPVGLIAIFTSVMIYHDTRRSLWRFPLGAARFFGTAICFLLLGLSISFPGLCLASALAICLKMIPEARLLRSPNEPSNDWRKIAQSPPEPDPPQWSPDHHSASLQLGPLRRILNARFILAFFAAFIAIANPWLALPVLLASEIMERMLFFQSVHAPKMPGNFGASSHN